MLRKQLHKTLKSIGECICSFLGFQPAVQHRPHSSAEPFPIRSSFHSYLNGSVLGRVHLPEDHARVRRAQRRSHRGQKFTDQFQALAAGITNKQMLFSGREHGFSEVSRAE